MALLQSLSPLYLTGLIIMLVWFYSKKIHKNETFLYGVFSALIIIPSIMSFLHLQGTVELNDGVFYTWVFRGQLAFACYIPVMFAGVLKPKTRLKIRFMQVRRELAIIGAILLVPHVILLIGRALSAMNPTGTLAFFMMIPLVITSFPKIRKMFTRDEWLGFHKWAYVVYGMIYVHIVSIQVLAQRTGLTRYDQLWMVRFFIITGIYILYLKLRFPLKKGSR